MKLTPDDVDVTIVHTYRLDEPKVIDRGPSADPVLATLFRLTKQNWIWGETHTDYDIYGQVLKADGTPDKRKEKGWFHLPGAPSLPDLPELAGKTLPNPRQPFLDALDALADERNA